MSFVRAHSPEQREVRRTAILDTAKEMLGEMPVADITLNGLSRRVCMAKSNVLRYFESREAVLLELCAEAMTDWVDSVEHALARDVDASASPRVRSELLAATVASSLAQRPVLCDLLSAQGSVLEHNVSAEVVLAYKRASIANAERLADVVSQRIPELDSVQAMRFVALAVMVTTSVWVHSNPPPAVVAAYESDECLTPFRMDFTTALREALEVILAGLLSR